MSVSLGRVSRLARKELRQMLRDLRMRGVIFVAPMIQLVVFGYAVSTDVRNVPVFVVDRDRSPESRQLVEQLTASGYFRLAGRSDDDQQLVAALEGGRALVGVEIPSGFSAGLNTGRGNTVQVLVDGTDSNTGTVALNYLLRLVRGISEDLQDETAVAGTQSGIALAVRAWYNPSLESRVYNVPAVVGALLLLITMLLTSLSVVRERETGTWEQLVVSPVSPTELMLGKTLPVALVGLVDLVLVSTIAILWFEIPFRGSPFTLLFAATAFIVAGLSLGLLISTISATQQEAFMTMFLILLPSLIFSGFMFPISSMPAGFQVATRFNPLRPFLEVVRGVFLKGAGLSELWLQCLVLAGMATIGLGMAVWRFRKLT